MAEVELVVRALQNMPCDDGNLRHKAFSHCVFGDPELKGKSSPFEPATSAAIARYAGPYGRELAIMRLINLGVLHLYHKGGTDVA